MSQQQKIFKTGAFISLGVLLLLLIGALIFWKERMLLCDASHISFEIINTLQLQLQQLRYGAFITQMFPLAAVKLHLPLRIILILYSASFNLFYLFILSLLVLRFKEYRLAILFTFYYTLITSDSFYWTNNEVHQGIAWMFLFFACLLKWRTGKQSVSIVWLILLAGLALITHPLVAVPFGYLYIFLWLQKDAWPFSKKQSILFGLLFLAMIIGKLVLSKTYSGYDADMLPKLAEFNPIKILSSEMAKELVKHAVKNYWIVPILFVWGMITAIRLKKYLIVILTTVSCAFYFILICATFKGYLAFYTETELMAGIILATTAFIYLSLPRVNYITAITILIFIFLVRLFYIGHSSEKFTARVHFIQNILNEMEQHNMSKLVLLKNNNTVDGRLMLDWATPSESIMLSALNGDKPQRNFVIVTPERMVQINIPRSGIYSSNKRWDNSQLNIDYFIIDTLHPYHVEQFDAFVRP